MAALKEIEEIISKIEGIKAVKVVGDGDDIKEIHVLAGFEKNPKQIVRDIETAVFAITGLKIDRKIVSVAQISGETKRRRRIALVDLEKEVRGLEVTYRVTVQKDGEEREGEASGPMTSPSVPMIIGNAILNAVQDGEIAISVDDVQVAKIFNREYVLSHLTCYDGKSEWEVIGIAPKGEDFERSCALSVIDAIEKVI